MSPKKDSHKIEWVFRIKIPQGKPQQLILLLHGWTGDENSMWIFTSRLPEDAVLLAARGIFRTPVGGYSWQTHESGKWPQLIDFEPTIDALEEFLVPGNFRDYALNEDLFSKIKIVGFSQGAALAFAYGLVAPEKIASIAGLSGFVPGGVTDIVQSRPLINKFIFLAHGTRDELVPIERARSAVSLLQLAGAEVTYCEDDVGHKLSASCFRGMEMFFKNN